MEVGDQSPRPVRGSAALAGGVALLAVMALTTGAGPASAAGEVSNATGLIINGGRTAPANCPPGGSASNPGGTFGLVTVGVLTANCARHHLGQCQRGQRQGGDSHPGRRPEPVHGGRRRLLVSGVIRSTGSNVNLSPDFPTDAAVMAGLYPHGGRRWTGVIAIDPAALAGLLDVVRSIDVPSRPTPITTANALHVLLYHQYQRYSSGGQRVDFWASGPGGVAPVDRPPGVLGRGHHPPKSHGEVVMVGPDFRSS